MMDEMEYKEPAVIRANPCGNVNSGSHFGNPSFRMLYGQVALRHPITRVLPFRMVTIQHIEFSVILEVVIGNPEGFSFESYGCPTNALGHDRRLVDSFLC